MVFQQKYYTVTDIGDQWHWVKAALGPLVIRQNIQPLLMREIIEIFVQFLVDIALSHDTFGIQNLGSEKLKLLVPIPRKIFSKRE
jgi:hypothetical protein